MWQNLQIHSIVQEKSRKIFSAQIRKMTECHFRANVKLRQPRIRATMVSPTQNRPRLRVILFRKLFKGYICFLGDSFVSYVFELFANETNLKKKRSVILCESPET